MTPVEKPEISTSLQIICCLIFLFSILSSCPEVGIVGYEKHDICAANEEQNKKTTTTENITKTEQQNLKNRHSIWTNKHRDTNYIFYQLQNLFYFL